METPIMPIKPHLPELTEGQCVHYVAYNGRHLAAMIIGHTEDGITDLAVFTNMLNAGRGKNFGTQFHQDVAYSQEKTPCTWHYIGDDLTFNVLLGTISVSSGKEQQQSEDSRVIKPTREAIIRQVKQTRECIDRAFRYAQYMAEMVNRGAGGRETALCITKLEEAKMWAGKALGALGQQLPEEYRDEAKEL